MTSSEFRSDYRDINFIGKYKIANLNFYYLNWSKAPSKTWIQTGFLKIIFEIRLAPNRSNRIENTMFQKKGRKHHKNPFEVFNLISSSYFTKLAPNHFNLIEKIMYEKKEENITKTHSRYFIKKRLFKLPESVKVVEANSKLLSFTFVRHPFSRIVSAYYDQVAKLTIRLN